MGCPEGGHLPSARRFHQSLMHEYHGREKLPSVTISCIDTVKVSYIDCGGVRVRLALVRLRVLCFTLGYIGWVLRQSRERSH